MTAIAAGSGRVRTGSVRLARAGLSGTVTSIAVAAVVLVGAHAAEGALDALRMAVSVVPVVVCLVTALMIVFAGDVTVFRSHLAVSLMLFISAGAVGDVSTVVPADAAWVSNVLTIVACFGFLPVAYFFPNGSPVPRWTLWLLPVWAVTGAGALAFPWDDFPVVPLVLLASVGSLLLATLIGSQLWRYRWVSTREERQQTKWVFIALVLMVLQSIVIMILPPGTIGTDPVITAVFSITGPAVATTLVTGIGFAMLRYRLFAIDLVIGRALVYGAVSVFVLSVYLLVVGAVGLAWPLGTPAVLPVAATAIAGVGLAPVYRLAQRAVNRRLYGWRDEPAVVLERLAGELADGSGIEATMDRVAGTLRVALRVRAVEIVAEDADGTPIATCRDGAEPMATASDHLPLVFEGRRIGEIRLIPHPGDRLGRRERELARRVASSAGIAVHAALVTRRLERSRAELVAAREDERVRLHRDLHDGVGPTLASVAQRLGRARQLVAESPDSAVALVRTAEDGVTRAMSELRTAVNGLRPPAHPRAGWN